MEPFINKTWVKKNPQRNTTNRKVIYLSQNVQNTLETIKDKYYNSSSQNVFNACVQWHRNISAEFGRLYHDRKFLVQQGEYKVETEMFSVVFLKTFQKRGEVHYLVVSCEFKLFTFKGVTLLETKHINKQRVRLTESQLNNIIIRCINEALQLRR